MKEMTLEQGFARLEEVTKELESGERSLEEMYALYKEGMDLAKNCSQKIDTVEKKLLLINSNGEYQEFE